jgi:hypothetical protein
VDPRRSPPDCCSPSPSARRCESRMCTVKFARRRPKLPVRRRQSAATSPCRERTKPSRCRPHPHPPLRLANGRCTNGSEHPALAEFEIVRRFARVVRSHPT